MSTYVLPTHHIESPTVFPFLKKLAKLDVPLDQILFSLGIQLVGESTNPFFLRFIETCEIKTVDIPEGPQDAFDLLGSVYQFLTPKHDNLVQGAFYTSPRVARELVGDLKFDSGQTILDPSCGSGVFLFTSGAGPEQVFGVDSDPLAVMIAKFNFFLKFPEGGEPHIYQSDFFEWASGEARQRFDYVIGNPPFGANLDKSTIDSKWVTSGESFSYFIEKSHALLSPMGIMRFIVPEALLNVKRHSDIRQFLLDGANLTRIRKFRKKFSGVMSDTFLIEVGWRKTSFVLYEDQQITRVPKSIFRGMQHMVFSGLDTAAVDLLRQVKKRAKLSLAESTFGLGVVTGDNKRLLHDKPVPESEPIFTGKEVERFQLLPARKYIVFDRSRLQQVAPDTIYRTIPKLVYKTVCKELKFAVDESGSLTSNSANIILPKVDSHDAESLAALLNSRLYSFIYKALFGGVNKVAKENLLALPIPKISEKEKRKLRQIVSEASTTKDFVELDAFIEIELFGLTPEQRDSLQ